MKNKLFSDNISPACEYCLHGRMTADKQSVLCVKHGVMMLSSSCKKFKYDPLKRTPNRQPKLGTFKNEDFMI